MKKKYILILIIILLALTSAYIFIPYKALINEYILNIFKPKFQVTEDFSKVDNNNNGVADALDVVNGANKEVLNKTKYVSNYFAGGYPPETEGVCTDVICRACSI